jgi:dipeptidyl aminopeptidase/acylaminoacyl peptidase
MPVSSPMDLRYGRVSSETGKGRVYRYLLQAPEDDVDASPICKLEGRTTPFHLMWGERDFEHIRDSCTRMCEALRANGQPVTQRVEPDAGHFDTHLQLNDARDDWYRVFRSFVGLSPENAG